jgi:phosphoribosylformimino-5-aminoimidazole carboxamide ribotide isomerase
VGSPTVNGAVVRGIVAAVGERMQVEVAGGLRTAEAVAAALEVGVARAVVGTAALRDPAFARDLVALHGSDRIAVALDVRDGLALGEGWRDGAPGVNVETALRTLADVGVGTFEVTAIERDGGLGGPDLALYERLIAFDRGAIIASGGISSVADLCAVRESGCVGAIVGRALLDGSLDLRAALDTGAAGDP